MTRWIGIVSVAMILILGAVAGQNYAGHWGVYLVFSLTSNFLLFSGFRSRALFFDTFIGVFLWLGFWLKFSIRVAFSGGVFNESVGAFDGSAESFDTVLWVASIGTCSLFFASFVRERLFSYPDKSPGCERSALFLFYRNHRYLVVISYLVLVLFVALTNVWLEIYQRGMISGTVLPFGLNGVYKWALQFGLASVAALIVRFEVEIGHKLTPLAIAVPIMEGFLSNTAMLSRGMVLNSSGIALGVLRIMFSLKMRVSRLSIGASVFLFALLFLISVLVVNYIRIASFNPGEEGVRSQTSEATRSMTTPLFVDRWVGIEGLMAVSSSRIQGWDLWRLAWEERFQEGVPTLYDRELISSQYTDSARDRSRNHFVSLPGIVAFLYYPGSIVFLCAALIVVAWFAAFLEIATYLYCGRNWILCALFAQVIAFRYASFGYVPAQSYLLFGSLVLNGVLIFGADRAFQIYYRGGAK